MKHFITINVFINKRDTSFFFIIRFLINPCFNQIFFSFELMHIFSHNSHLCKIDTTMVTEDN